ncbi:hypothetical protein D0Z08_26105 [Nocardioides immobilis]|uniref:Uncharacterized protein n=2 Tax=Nocardioides immobilis TaxID=2049295 RepID=A0A417XUK5_9ACTN|nr:hypothetical protein D0Z08_26105 [Nocardioides immobilis]
MTLCAVGALVVVTVPAVPSSTYADSGPIYGGVRGFAVDVERDRIYVSAFQDGAAELLVTSPRGEVIASVDGIAGTGQPVMSNDGSMVLMALPGQDAVAVVDSATLSTRTVDTGPGTCPSQITETGGGFWVLVGCSEHWDSVAHVDLESGHLRPFTVEGWPEHRPTITASPALPDTLVLASAEPARIDLLTASATGVPSLSIRASREVAPGGERPVAAVSPDGTRIVVSSETRFLDLSSDSLETMSESSVANGHTAANVAFRYDGWRADVHYSYAGSHNAYIVVMRRPDGSEFRRFKVPTGLTEGAFDFSRSFAWGSRHLYAVVANTLRVFEQRLPSGLRIRLDQERYELGDVANVRVRLQSDSPNRRVSLYATQYGGDRRLVTSADVDEDGYLHAQLRVRRNTELEAHFDGDADNEDATVGRLARVEQPIRTWLKGYRRMSGRYAVYGASDRTRVVADPLDGQPRDFLCFRVYTAEDTGWTYWYTDCGHLDQSLTTSARLRTSLVGDRVRVRAEWEGKRGFATSLGPWKYYRVVR